MTPREALDMLELLSAELRNSEGVSYAHELAQIVRYALPADVIRPEWIYGRVTEDAIARAYDNGRRDAGDKS
jgi:hypothetical protein